MAKREKFGKFVLLEEIDSSGLGQECRAAKLGPTGLEKIVTVLKLRQNLSSQADAIKSLMDQVKFAAQLQNPNVLKIYGIGKVDSSYYISFEFLEGKSLKAIFNRCRQEGFPFSVDHALLITSKICSALEYAHGRKSESGGRYYHGLVTPGSALVSYEGEVRLRGFGYWHSKVREVGGALDEEGLYLSPEQAAGAPGDTRSDTFAVGELLFETLTGEAFFHGGRTDDISGRLARARLQSPMSDDDSLPKPIAEILQRSLTKDPGVRYAEIQEMRKAVDTLLFSGDFTPTTFNLAFFMHSLFREDIERESKTLKEEREASYFDYLSDALPSVASPRTVVSPPTQTQPVDLREVQSAVATMVAPPEIISAPPPPPPMPPREAPREVAREAPREIPREVPREIPRETHREPTPRETPIFMPPPTVNEPPPVSAKEAAASFTFHKESPKSKMPLMAGGGLILLLLVGTGAYFLLRNRSVAPPAPALPTTTTLSPEQIRVRELEEKLKAMEAEKAAAEEKAKQEAAKKIQDAAAKTGAAVDPEAVKKAQEEAAKKVRLEQEKKQREEQARLDEAKKAEEARLAEEQRKAEEARLAEEKRKADEAAAAAAAATPTPPPAIRPGTLVQLSDPGVVQPVVERRPTLVYPPIALRQRVEGTVELNVLVDEKGNVSDAQVVTGAGGKAGLNEAAIDHVRRCRYRAATKDGVPVKVWIAVKVQFKLPS